MQTRYELVCGEAWAKKFVDENVKLYGPIQHIYTEDNGETEILLTDDSGIRRTITLSSAVQCVWLEQVTR